MDDRKKTNDETKYHSSNININSSSRTYNYNNTNARNDQYCALRDTS